MATTDFPVNHPLARKVWARKLFQEVIGESYVGKFIGTGTDSLIHMKTELQKDAGDKITFGLRMLLTGTGQQGDNTLQGNEEGLTLYNDAVVLNQLRHAVRTAGKMSDQRVMFSTRDEAKSGLADWWKERIEISVANQLTGYASQSDSRYTGNQAAIEPSSTRIVVGGGHDTEASLSLTTTHAIKLADLDRAAAKAKVLSPRIRPVNVDGKKMYVAFLHPYQIYQLRRDASTAGNFFDVQKAMLQGGKISNNPIVTGAEFIYNNVIVHEWSYLPNVLSSVTSATNYRRGVFCGAQALVAAFGQGGSDSKMDWVEEKFDYSNQLGVAAGLIYGFKKSVFNSTDFATIVLSGYAPAA